jgi:hypothetical protein
MDWNPPTKLIDDLNPIAIKQKLERGGDGFLLPDSIGINWLDLVLSLARTSTMETAVPELSGEERLKLAYGNGYCEALKMRLYIDASSKRLLFTRGVDILADERRTSLAASLGATIADLTMERLGFHWRANTREILPSIPKNFLENGRIPDFVYDPAGTHGFQAGSIVAVEAKGSLSNNKARRRPILNLAQNAYNEQVRQFIGAPAGDVVVASGFAIAYGTVPGDSTSTLAIASPQTVGVDARSGAHAHSLSAAASYANAAGPKSRRADP